MNGRQYNIDIDTYYGRVKCEEYERNDATLAAIQQLHIEMHNLQEQMTEKQKAVEILTKYCCDEIGGRNQ